MPKYNTRLEMITRLISIPSVSSALPELDQGNRAVVDTLADRLQAAGFRIEILPVNPDQEKYNLVATRGEGSGGLVLAGHTDTVPTNPELWRHNPFKLTEDGGRLYGLGTADMKAFFALAIEAAETFSGQRLKEPLTILATADEESSMSGAKALAAAGTLRARGAIIGEPTGNRPVRMHKGITMERIRVLGQSGHSSNPALGRNALEGMYKVLTTLLEFRDELQARYHNEQFEVPVPTLNLGHIQGGDNPNRICGDCLLDIDLRPLPGMDIVELRQTLRQRLQNCLAGDGLQLEFEMLFPGIPAMETPAGSELVKTVESLSGCRSEAVAFGTEAPYLQELGMDVVIMGPGRIEQAHQPDEYIEIGAMEPYIELLKQLIYKYCVVGH